MQGKDSFFMYHWKFSFMDDNFYLIYKKYINVIISCDCFSCLELESVILMEK